MNLRPILRATAAATLACAGLMLAATGFAQTVKIGMINSLTGPHSSFDLPASEGVQMAVDEINKKGGITVKGKKHMLSVVSEDAQSKPEFAVSGAQRLLRDDDIKVVFGILTSGPGMAAATALGKSDVLYIGGFTLLDTLLGKPGGEMMIRTLNNDATVAKSFVPASVKELGLKKVGIMLPNEDVSKSIVAVYKPLLEANGVQVPMVEYFQPDTQDFAPVLRKFQNQGLDGMLTGTNDALVEAILRQASELGGLPKKFMYRGGSGAPAIKYAKAVDGFTWQILSRDIDNTSDPKVKEWVERYKGFTKKDVSPNTYWALTFYDSVFMVAKAMEEVGSTSDVKAIAAKVKDMKYEGVRTMRFDKDGHAQSDIDIGMLKDGKVTSVRASAM
ncbi:MAG: ABC transporter substrate-binding protein [Gammaproteobacteria bacterium]|nr:ABC transporter substrate-binding protein [Gammaproteobacteria bacterium]MBU2287791.1 ABC transporter substrate-binding protein [Gammaproteobacteria bacterium]MBU2410398.1 ABC transporter substrate-binding protein [Gammaproteobacteria bacterium]